MQQVHDYALQHEVAKGFARYFRKGRRSYAPRRDFVILRTGSAPLGAAARQERRRSAAGEAHVLMSSQRSALRSCNRLML